MTRLRIHDLVIDGMEVVQELVAVTNYKTCKDFGVAYVKLIDSKAQNYDHVRVILDNYTKVSSLKEATTEQCRTNVKELKSYVVTDSTCIKDNKLFLASC